MSDLISRQAAIDALDDVLVEDDSCKVWFKLALKQLPSAERLGRWEHLGGDEWFCTACAHVITTEGSWERPCQKYCEECGAKMEGDEE